MTLELCAAGLEYEWLDLMQNFSSSDKCKNFVNVCNAITSLPSTFPIISYEI